MRKKLMLVMLPVLLAAVLCALPAMAGTGVAITEHDALPEYYGNGGDVVVPDGIKSIDNYAFENCTGLTSIRIPGSVTYIGKYAFSGCSNMTSIDIAYGVTKFDVGAFEDCSGLKSINIPKSVTGIENDVFAYCSSLKSIDLPYGVTRIGDAAFWYCTGLTSIHIPDSVTSIAYHAFYHCDSLTSIVIPDSVTSFGKDVFKYCSNLTVYVNKGSAAHTYCVENNIPYRFLGEGAEIDSAVFASAATVGKPVSITVKTNKAAKYVRMCAENGDTVKTWSTGYTDSGDVRTWKLSYTFSGAGSRSLTFKASADNSRYDSSVVAKVTVSKAAKIDSVKFNSAATVGKAVGITVTTPTTVKYIAMCSSNGAAYKTWTSGYTDNGGTRTWKVNYTFSGSGNRTMYFKASADNSTWSTLVSTSVTVNKAVAGAEVTSAYFTNDAVIGRSVAIVVRTTTAAKYVRMCSENGGTVKTWSSGYSDSGDVRTWKFTYSFSGTGYRSLTFKASADNSSYDAGVVAKVAVNPAVPVVSSASFNASSAKVNQSVGITVKTSSNATALALCSENGAVVKTWSASGNSSVSGNVRTWNVSYAFGGAGARSIGFKASADGGSYGSAVTAKITITK